MPGSDDGVRMRLRVPGWTTLLAVAARPQDDPHWRSPTGGRSRDRFVRLLQHTVSQEFGDLNRVQCRALPQVV